MAVTVASMLVAGTKARAQDLAPKTPPGFDIAAEMTELYGNYLSEDGLSVMASPSDASEKLDVRAFFVASVSDSENEEVLLATYAVPDEGNFDCHACLPLIGGALFKKDKGGWIREAAALPCLAFGEGGEAPNASLVRFGPHQYGIKLEDSGVHGGRNFTETALFLPWNGGFSNALYKTTMEDSSGDESGCQQAKNKSDDDGGLPCIAYHSNLKFVPGSDPDYYDLVIKTSGTRLDGLGADGSLKVEDASETVRLRFVDGRYSKD
jgi:hypothetical protein